MPLKKNNIVKEGKELNIKTVKIDDIHDCDKTKQIGEYTFEYPYQFELTCDGQILDTEPSQPGLTAKKWNKKFYIRSSEKDGKVYENVSFTRDATLLAVITVLRKLGEVEIEYPFDVNEIIGKEFEASVVILDEYKFIDWIGTFEHHGIRVPTIEELGGKKVENKKDDEATKKVKDDLPF